MKPKVLMAMSGGIDSTAAALLLKEQGYDIVGCTFRTRYSNDESVEAAADLAHRLGIEHIVLDLDAQFQTDIVDYFCHEYLAGRTPNPCVRCNRLLKFGVLLRQADELGCEKIATGHYARIVQKDSKLFLNVAKDETKDQTYFLWQLSQEQLARILFPLGDFTKEEIRKYLAEKGYVELSHQTESQDICFIENDYRDFLLQYAQTHPEMKAGFCPGKYLDSEGRVVGSHQGFANYTIGQRKGLGIALGVPAFITKIDSNTNEVTVGTREDLLRNEIYVKNIRFEGDSSRSVFARIRYRSHPSEARVLNQNDDRMMVQFVESVWGVTPGQSCVFYQDGLLVGGGVICTKG